MTDAHDQPTTLHILAHIPEHAPREHDPHYHLFEQAKARIKQLGLWKCAINDDLCGGQLELHHSHVEFSQANAVDPAKIEAAFGLHFTSDEDFQQWIESPSNLEVLCLPGDEAVRMADGTLKPIGAVQIGELVLGHDGVGHAVASISISAFAGSLVCIDGHRMTGNHPVLTERGWIAAASVRPGDFACFMAPANPGSLGGEFGMLDAEMFSMAGVQAEVLRSVVVTDPVDVVDGLDPCEWSANDLFHDESVFHDEAPAASGPVDDTYVAGGLRVTQAAALMPGLVVVETPDPAGVRTVQTQPCLDLPQLGGEFRVAGGASPDSVSAPTLLAPQGTTYAAACRVPLGYLRRHTVVLPACDALPDGGGQPAPYERRWRPIKHVDFFPFRGEVYDIEVPGCQSFVSSDLVVHNCTNHHRTHYGVHTLPAALWETLRWHRAGQPAPAEFVAAKDLPA